ncbi:MAG: pilus assembly protein PilM [Nitrospira sp.]|nr:hypothetical protein [Candidatus Manganitrophaceae bacterium]HIL35379.1 hypothetical protein [Candidatus Manganitrophaceae bacterium]
MGQTILGLDIGSSAIRGVRITEGFRGLRLLRIFEQKVFPKEEGDLSEAAPLCAGQIEALAEMVSEGLIRPGEMICVSLPGHLVSTRKMTLPFTDPKKLKQVVPYEMESTLPFDLEEVAIDYQVLATEEGGSEEENESANEAGARRSHLLVSTVRKTVLQTYLQGLQSVGIDPAWVSIDAIALKAFSQHFIEHREEASGDSSQGTGLDAHFVIDVGTAKTVLSFIQGGRLSGVRTLPMGGRLITDALGRAFELSVAEAEKLKQEIRLDKAEQAPESIEAVACVKQAIEPWLTEIEKSLRYFRTSNSPRGETVEGLLTLCGGGGTLKGLKEILAETLDMDSSRRGGPDREGFSMAGLEILDTPSIFHTYHMGLGLALLPKEGTQINFRQGEFVYGKETIERRNRLASIGFVALLLFALIVGDLYLRYDHKEQRYRDLKEELRKTFLETFPGVRNVMNEVEQARVEIEVLKRTGDFLGVGEESPLKVLQEITSRVPKEVRIDVQELVIDGENVRILARTDSFDSVDRIRNGFLKAKRFREVSVSDAKVMADQSQVRFRIKMKRLDQGEGNGKRLS